MPRRFAAKEACAKALGTGMRRGVFWRDMGVVNLRGRAADHAAYTGGALQRGLRALTPEGHEAVRACARSRTIRPMRAGLRGDRGAGPRGVTGRVDSQVAPCDRPPRARRGGGLSSAHPSSMDDPREGDKAFETRGRQIP